MDQSIIQNKFKLISEREQWLTSQLMNTAISIHRILGPGLLESIYEKCFCYELAKRNIDLIGEKHGDAGVVRRVEDGDSVGRRKGLAGRQGSFCATRRISAGPDQADREFEGSR